MSTEKEKTCGECKYFILDSSGFCKSNKGQEDSGNDCCSFFEPKVITNGDRIRQMSNKELANYLSSTDVNACVKDRDHCKEEHWICDNCWFEWLEGEWKA